MAPLNDMDRLDDAWRALSGEHNEAGWRTIPMDLESPCRLLAGRHYPGNEEALLVGFQSVRLPPDSQLPQGRGFLVASMDRSVVRGAGAWLCLSRQATGSLELFRVMGGDIFRLLRSCPETTEELLLRLFLGRIRAWQNFMEKDRKAILHHEAEVGLVGELVVLRALMLDANLESELVLEAWQGPLDGEQDFILGKGAIEVKATLAQKGFPATIGSLEQLDESLRSPLFLAGVRLKLDRSGRTLPEFVDDLREAFRDDPGSIALLESRMVAAGYFEGFAGNYTRRFTHAGTVVYAVDKDFPRLTHGNVGVEIRKARYEIDLDLIHAPDMGLDKAMEQIGII